MTTTHPFTLSVEDGVTAYLPIVTGSSLTDCAECGDLVGGNSYIVERDGEGTEWPLCGKCSKTNPALWPWADLVAAYNALDDAFKGLRTRGQRQSFANLLADHVGHVASWRWPDEEPIEPQPIY